jgi:hypothetical protein
MAFIAEKISEPCLRHCEVEDRSNPVFLMDCFTLRVRNDWHDDSNHQTIKQQTNMKTNLSRLPQLIIFAAIASITFTTHLSSQVTVGSNIASTKGALLDLKTRQISGKPAAGVDPNNYTASLGGGGLLLPRVILEGTNSLKPLLTDAEATDSLKYLLTGLMVYNIATVGSPVPSLYPSVYTWDGSQWKTSEANKVDILTITTQPKTFSFNESGSTDSVKTLSVITSGGVGTLKYQWYQISGNNVHVRVGDSLVHGNDKANGSQTASYRPVYRTAKGTTRNAGNCGLYRFYCVVTDDAGQRVESNTAEVAVGCGAKNNVGEWITFMCYNLGAQHGITIDEQKNYPTNHKFNATSGLHTYVSGEENAYGDMFQWGRIPDGHEERNSPVRSYGYGSPGITIMDSVVSGYSCSSTNTPARPSLQVKKTSPWHGRFITNGSSPYGWNPNSDANGLWNISRSVPNDPCAHYNIDGTYVEFWNEDPRGDKNDPGTGVCQGANTGWKLPSPEEFGAIYKGGTMAGTPGSATANTWVWNNGGASWSTDVTFNHPAGHEIRPDNETTTLFLPAVGYRNGSSADLYNPGHIAYYWSGSSTGTSAYALYFEGGNIDPVRIGRRSFGYAVRCIRNI